jgi:hydroxymethylbilane synthase
MTLTLRIGTRRSTLAMTQTGHVRQALAGALGVDAADIDARLPLVPIVTTGDRIQDRRLLEVGGKALFTKEIEAALIDGRCDLAVHSLKDVPVEPPPGLKLAAIPVREDPRDAFVSERFDSVLDLPEGARVGTASLRRQAQLLALRPDLRIELLRGNVDTRLKRVADGEFEAILLAASGLNRLGRGDRIRALLPVEDFVPAPGQGALALQTREDGAPGIEHWGLALNHPATALAVKAERAAMRALEGSCRTAVGAHAWLEGEDLVLIAERLRPDGTRRWRETARIPLSSDVEAAAEALGQTVQNRALADGEPFEN